MSAIVEKKLEEIGLAMKAFEIENATTIVLHGAKTGVDSTVGSEALVHIPPDSRGIPVAAAGIFLKGFGIKSISEMGETGQFITFKLVTAKRGPRKNKDGEGDQPKDSKKK